MAPVAFCELKGFHMLNRIAQYIDHTNLSADANGSDIKQLCAEAHEYGFAAVCVNPLWVKLAADELFESDVEVCCVIGFPTGAHLPDVKLFEAKLALEHGACELDTVINIAALKANDYESVRADVEPLVKLAHENKALLKVILEIALLTDEEIIRGCQWCEQFGADFVKTSTGMLKGENTGATTHVVRLMRESVSEDIGIKASGGVRDFTTAEAMIEAGATRIGTSSSVAMMQESD
jgi:deoxyribose-phosphate aldolase